MKNNILTDSNLYFFSSIIIIFLNFFFLEYASSNLILLTLILFVVFFGLPHGALDTMYAKKNKLYNNLLGFFSFNLIYLSIAIITFFLWLMFPVFFFPYF